MAKMSQEKAGLRQMFDSVFTDDQPGQAFRGGLLKLEEDVKDMQNKNMKPQYIEEQKKQRIIELKDRYYNAAMSELSDAARGIARAQDEHIRESEKFAEKQLLRDRRLSLKYEAMDDEEVGKIAESYIRGDTSLGLQELNLLSKETRNRKIEDYGSLRAAMKRNRDDRPWTQQGDGAKAFERYEFYRDLQYGQIAVNMKNSADDPEPARSVFQIDDIVG